MPALPASGRSTAASRAAEVAAAKAKADWLAYREAILDDLAEGKTVTPARRSEAGRLRAAAGGA